MLVPLLGILLSTFLLQRMFKKRPRFQRPPLSFLVGFPVALTLLLVDLDLVSVRVRGGISVLKIVLFDAAVILSYALWARIFLRVPRPPLRN